MARFFPFLLFLILTNKIIAQDNYEIQVYGSETMTKGKTMVELHSNFTFDGGKSTDKSIKSSNHIEHETIEITHGFNDWFEVGFYLFNAIGDNNRTAYVGSHIRPRVCIPERFHLPVGLSLSAEVGYQKPTFISDDWTIELRPIIDKKINKLYLCLNPVLEKSLHGTSAAEGYSFSPNAKISYDINKSFSPGIEYYGSLGTWNNFAPSSQQEHNLFISLDADLHPNLELNVGYGWGLNRNTDNSIVKCIVGWKF